MGGGRVTMLRGDEGVMGVSGNMGRVDGVVGMWVVVVVLGMSWRRHVDHLST